MIKVISSTQMVYDDRSILHDEIPESNHPAPQ